jgi:predicted metal-dependent phosphoesterase TrpH
LIPYTSVELIDRAAQLGFDALAITLHEKQRAVRDLSAYARASGVTLIPGVERTIQRKHVLLLNFPAGTESVDSFGRLADLKARYPEGLVVAPHPFFPHPSCLGRLMDRYADLFDAIEVNACHTALIDFNRRARRWATAHGKPLVANSDAHRLTIFGTSWSLVDSEADAGAICAAIRLGRVQTETRPLSGFEVAAYLARLGYSGLRARWVVRRHPETRDAAPQPSMMLQTSCRPASVNGTGIRS